MAFKVYLLLLALGVSRCGAYTTFMHPLSSNQAGSTACCILDSWSYSHIDEVRQFANKLRLEYNAMSRGSVPNQYVENDNWKDNILQLTGVSPSELSALGSSWGQKLVSDIRSGLLSYDTLARPNFFEYKAAEILKSYSKDDNEFQQQQILEAGHFQPLDLSDFDEVKNYAYPAEVKVINGKTFVVHKNCTEATKTVGEGIVGSPLVTVQQRNRTTILNSGSNHPEAEGVYVRGGEGVGSSSLLVSHKKNIYDWANTNLEPLVVDYKPTVSIGSNWALQHSSSNTMNADQVGPSFNYFKPESTVTVHRYNETIIRNADGTDRVSGSEVRRKWVDGRLVYDDVRPFGEQQMTGRANNWQREERERLFWLLTDDDVTMDNLEAWQRQQEERILAMAQRYQTTTESIQTWHRQELERFKKLLVQYRANFDNNAKSWEYNERGRLDWLIHQNSVTKEELMRWQRENQEKLLQLARRYGISLREFKSWQIEELNRLYVVFEEQNNSMIPPPSSSSLHTKTTSEQQRLEALIREHNATIAQLQNSIQLDQRKLNELRTTYRGNVDDMEKWLKTELARLGGIINEQRQELTKLTTWQSSERQRMEQLLQSHRGSIAQLESQMANDRNYIKSLASKYHVSIEELEKWQKAELERLQSESETQMALNVKAWQAKEHENLKSIIQRNDLTIEEFQSKIMNDRSRLEELARTYKVQVSEIENWFKQELKNFQNSGLLKEVEKEMAAWQQKERQRLLDIVQQNELSIEDLEKAIKKDQSQLYTLANTYQIRVEELEEWLKKELLRLQNEGFLKVQDLKDWQLNEREHIMKLVQENKLTIEEFEQKLLKDRERLQQLSNTYNIQRSELETWIREEGKRLQQLGLLQMQDQLSQWQKIERERLRQLIDENKLTVEELEERLRKDRTHLYILAHQHQVRVEEVEAWIKEEIQKLQQQGLLEMAKLKDWQTDWRGNLTNMVQERDFTVEEFHKWLLDDRARLQALAKTHNVQIEELEQWVHNEEQRFVSLGLLKPNEKLTNWQEVERRYLERIAQEQQYRSTEQLEQRLRQDRELLEQLARQYSVQVDEIQQWMKKELARLRDEGQLQIDNLTSWQLTERERLEELTKAKKEWSLEDLEATLRKDREHMQKLAFQYHTSMEEIEKWLQAEITRLQQQGKLEIKNLTAWQQAEQERILNLLGNHSSITAAEFERKVQQDYTFLQNLSNEYHVNVLDVEAYVKKVIEELKQKGKFEMQNLQTWQLVERDYIKQVLAQYNNELTTAEFAHKLQTDRSHLQQLAAQYRISVDQIEKWMLEELARLRNSSENGMKQLSTWQANEVERLKMLIQQNQKLDYVTYEMELMKERERLQSLAKEYAWSVEQLEAWLRQQLLNLKTTGDAQVESLTKWQTEEQKRLIGLLLQQQQSTFTVEEFESQLRQNQTRLHQLAQDYSVSMEQIESWMRDELKRLQSSGLVHVENLNSWQQNEKGRLEEWLRQLNHNVSYTELQEFLIRDRQRLSDIAREYHVTVEEVEAWVQMEAARLQFLNAIKQPNQLITVVVESDADDLWKVHTKAHLRGIAQAKPMSWQDFEQYLQRERFRWQRLAYEYNITVEDIEAWLRVAARELQSEGLIQEKPSFQIEQWQVIEQAHIQNLINNALRENRQQWTIEELETWLQQDILHLQQLVKEYNVAINTITDWYRAELHRLLIQQKLLNAFTSEEWKHKERQRIYAAVSRQSPHLRTFRYMEMLLLQNKTMLDTLAREYKVTAEELTVWTTKELQRLLDLGILTDERGQGRFQNWQQKEKQRLRLIAKDLRLTEAELLEFIAGDLAFQQQLADNYGCSMNQLVPFQRIEISNMQREQLFENRALRVLEPWQIKERERIYGFIKNQNLTLKNLRAWQNQDIFINEISSKYGIEANTLKNWQLQEFERLMKLAASYRMNLHQLQQFREKELQRRRFIMHKELSSIEEMENWYRIESKQRESLERLSGHQGSALDNWRRTLYLLCQGLLHLDNNNGSSSATHFNELPMQQNISKDRGDQPPHIHEETLDGNEPGLEGEHPIRPPIHPSPPAQIIAQPSTTEVVPHPPHHYIRPATTASGGIESGYRYTKHEYKYTAPATIGAASASASANSYGSTASASIISTPLAGHAHGRRHSNTEQTEDTNAFGLSQQREEETWDDNQQQQQIEQLYDIGQRPQNVVVPYSARQPQRNQQQVEDFGQQQQQLEDFGQQQQQEEESDYQFSHNSRNPQRSSRLESTQTAATIVETQPDPQPESTGFWSNIKKKTTDLFG